MIDSDITTEDMARPWFVVSWIEADESRLRVFKENPLLSLENWGVAPEIRDDVIRYMEKYLEVKE